MEVKSDNIVIHNIEEYEINFYEGNLILTKKKKHIDLTKYNFQKSEIIFCSINNKKIELNKYRSICKYIYEYINNKDLIIENTLLNTKSGKYTLDGYSYFEKLDFSLQGCDANKSIKEIIHMCKLSNIKIKLKIKLENNKIINL
jgi:hypothetical protein